MNFLFGLINERKIMYNNIFLLAFNPTNGICNESFFENTITLYPTNETGNIYFSNKIVDISSKKVLNEYKSFIYNTTKKIVDKNRNAKFILYNDKKRITDLCSNMLHLNIIQGNSTNIISNLNNKFYVREYLRNDVPILNYIYFDKEHTISYHEICKIIKNNIFVAQTQNGAGGNGTEIITSKDEFDRYLTLNNNFSISRYFEHIPINITLVIGNNSILFFPISFQIIEKSNNIIKYIGGDFYSSKFLDKQVHDKIKFYSNKIALKMQKIGYRGIAGIDFIITNNEVYFLEINPRYQASSFIISRELEKTNNCNLALLHYQAITAQDFQHIDLASINYSFLNCNEKRDFTDQAIDYETETITNGYFNKDTNSIYRKIYNGPIFNKLNCDIMGKNYYENLFS